MAAKQLSGALACALLLCGTALGQDAKEPRRSETPGGPPPAQHAQHEHAAGGAPANKGRTWTQLPLVVPAGRSAERGVANLGVRNIPASALRVFDPEKPESPQDISIVNGSAKVTSDPNWGGIHWIMARNEADSGVTVASAIWPFSSKGASPQAMLDMPKSELEIVPQPATMRYREGERWNFLIRYSGKPWGNAPVLVETENGSRLNFTANGQGLVSLEFPHDFDPRKYPNAEDFTRVSAQFALSVRRTDGEKRYLTAFNGAYSPDRMRERSLIWGAVFTLLGMTLAALLLFRRKENRHA